ncbi:hypothetical protein THAOC_06308, partial [Thalassiosira oceanica]
MTSPYGRSSGDGGCLSRVPEGRRGMAAGAAVGAAAGGRASLAPGHERRPPPARGGRPRPSGRARPRGGCWAARDVRRLLGLRGGGGDDARAARDVKAAPTGRRRDGPRERGSLPSRPGLHLPREDEADLDSEGFCDCPGTAAFPRQGDFTQGTTAPRLELGRAWTYMAAERWSWSPSRHRMLRGQNATGGGGHKRRPAPVSLEREDATINSSDDRGGERKKGSCKKFESGRRRAVPARPRRPSVPRERRTAETR